MPRISNDDVYVVYDLLTKSGICVMDVPHPDGRRLVYPCWVGPVSAAMGAVAEAEEALDRAGFMARVRWRTQADRKQAHGRCTVAVAPG